MNVCHVFSRGREVKGITRKRPGLPWWPFSKEPCPVHPGHSDCDEFNGLEHPANNRSGHRRRKNKVKSQILWWVAWRSLPGGEQNGQDEEAHHNVKNPKVQGLSSRTFGGTRQDSSPTLGTKPGPRPQLLPAGSADFLIVHEWRQCDLHPTFPSRPSLHV